jgi:Ni/Fe-hydrogenase subunit HybB-like protein
MKSWKRWPYLITGLAAASVAVSSIVQAVRQGSWEPIVTVAWIPAVIVATWPGARRRCLPRRGGQAGGAV